MSFNRKKLSILKAYETAKRDLRSNYGALGIYAGPKNHHEYWARDSLFASYGSLALNDKDIVRKNLDLFALYQSPIGHIPLRVEERFHALNFLGLDVRHKSPKAIFSPSQPWAGEVIDSNPLYLIMVAEYLSKVKRNKWTKQNRKPVMDAVSWLVGKFDEKNLVHEGINANWADFTFKSGNVLYTNILVWKAFNLLCKTLPQQGAKYCLDLSDRIEIAIKKHFWHEEEGFFIDNIGKTGRKHEVFASDGNLLAVFLDFASREESVRIFHYIDKYKLDHVPVPIYYPRLIGKHNILNRLIFPNYNSTYTFMWWGSISSVARMKIHDGEGALHDLYSLAKIINRYKTVPEIVNPKGRVVNKFFYKPEMAISWAAGLFVYATLEAKKRGLI